MATNRKLKDSVFTKIFGEPEYAFQLYKVFHPEDMTSTEKEIKIITLENIFINGEYNDLGLLLNNRLMLFVEAQSTWNDNMPIRMLFYLAETYRRYMIDNKINILKDTDVVIPIPETYVIFTGKRDNKPEIMKLSDHFPKNDLKFVSEKKSLELNVKMIYNSNEGDIVYQYITFCKVFDAQKTLHHDDHDKAIMETIRICKDSNVLSDFLKKHESEVCKVMYESVNDFLVELHIECEKDNARKTGYKEGYGSGYNTGYGSGYDSGYDTGKSAGVHDNAIETARKMLAEGLQPELVAKCTSLNISEVVKLQTE